jgi:hypothetical protein
MRRLDRHASPDDLASLSVGELRRRRALKIEAHVSGCVQCTTMLHRLDELPGILASTSYPAMPPHLTIRIETAIHAEVRQRLADLPATEAGRGELPARRQRRATQQGWRLPGLSVPVTRLVGALGAIVLIAVGAFEGVSHSGSGPGATSSANGAQAAPTAPPQQLNLAPSVTYGPSHHAALTVRSNTNFVKASLASEVEAAVRAAEARRGSASAYSGASPGPLHSSAGGASPAGASASVSGLPAGLAACVSLIASGHNVQLIDLAYFQRKPATLIVLAATAVSPAEAWVVGSQCSATTKDVLAHVQLPHL